MTQNGSDMTKKSFKDTLNLPTTDFPIRSNPKIEDSIILQRWHNEDLYSASFIHNEGKEKFILHDGPPYANGHIHLGSAYNKILKDIVTKSQRMMGKHVPVTPGWDCHGLPIELKVIKEFPELPADQVKKQCRLYAQKWIAIQKEEFKKLGVVMDWNNPYLTMDFSYEADIIRAFGVFFKEGFIEKKNKTVAWCMYDQTVLATAEIEYKERKDPSIYVRFELEPVDVNRLLPQYAGKKVSILVWTTTPWTLPLNRAVLLRPQTVYDVLTCDDEYIIVAQELSEKVCSLKELQKNVKTSITSEVLATGKVHHPFIKDLAVPLILDHSVSLEDGTAAVHCAPGCGPQDYEVARKHNLEIYSPLTPDGKYTHDIKPAELVGMSVTDGQIWVIKKLAENGSLFFKTNLRHSYPHCWRCHQGLIFRATNQWFCSLMHDHVREHALKSLEAITFLPEKSKNYLKATLENRLEWCLSRQRMWGVPIPALLCSSCNYVYTSESLIEKVAQGVQKEGVEYWDTVPLQDLNLDSLQCQQCQAKTLVKEKDILDVWFDSGVSHFAVLLKNKNLAFPADMYCEGIDQHRGWFQSSLLTSLVLEKSPCTKAFLTHGFTVDEHGQKMSKSIGNVVSPDEIVAKVGTDGLRLWAASIDYAGDAIMSEKLLANVGHVLQKIRNTCRFLLANLYDFSVDTDNVILEDLLLIDQYALQELYEVSSRIKHHYMIQDFTAIAHELNDYCTVKLSALYLDIIKDRLYTDKKDGIKRRSAQTVCWIILDTITKLMAPILSFTAEQISDHYQKNKSSSIHLQNFSELDSIFSLINKRSGHEKWHIAPLHIQTTVEKTAESVSELSFISLRKRQWELLLKMRSAFNKAIEIQREKGIIKHSLEASITFYCDFTQQDMEILNQFIKDLKQTNQNFTDFIKEFLIVSQVTQHFNATGLQESEMKGLYVTVEHAHGTKCPRCWQWEETSDVDGLCSRCQEILRK